jgi:hypothetical protein
MSIIIYFIIGFIVGIYGGVWLAKESAYEITIEEIYKKEYKPIQEIYPVTSLITVDDLKEFVEKK